MLCFHNELYSSYINRPSITRWTAPFESLGQSAFTKVVPSQKALASPATLKTESGEQSYTVDYDIITVLSYVANHDCTFNLFKTTIIVFRIYSLFRDKLAMSLCADITIFAGIIINTSLFLFLICMSTAR